MDANRGLLDSCTIRLIRTWTAIILLAVVLPVNAGFAQTYSMNFEGEENPLSENGKWVNNSLDWTKIRKGGGIAYGTQSGTKKGPARFDDSFAHLTGFPPDHEAWGGVLRVTKPDPNCNQEVEILLRWTSSEHSTTGDECFGKCVVGNRSWLQIVRWDGPLGKYTTLVDKLRPRRRTQGRRHSQGIGCRQCDYTVRERRREGPGDRRHFQDGQPRYRNLLGMSEGPWCWDQC